MSRNSLHRPRPPRAVWNCPATYTRLLPNPYSPCPQLNTHYKRCPRAERLRLRSDQSSSRPLHGRSPDKSRHALLQGSRLRISAPVEGHTYVADLVLAGESQQSDERRLKTNAPFKDSTVVTTGELPTTNAGHGSTLLSLRMVEHFWWTRPPRTENFSALLHILSEVRGKDSPVAALGEADPRSGGNESTLPFLRMVEHFWWTRLPHSEIPSRLLHILSEVRGCRRVVVDVEYPLWRTPSIGTGVDAFSRNRPGPSIPHSFLLCQHSGLFTPSFLRRQSLPLRRQGNLSPEAGRGAPSVAATGWSPWGEASSHHPRKAPSTSARPRREKPGFPQNNQKSRLSPRINQNPPPTKGAA